MRKTRRTSRVGEMIRDALVDVLRHDVKDANMGLNSITGIDVSPDLHTARVFVSGLVENEAQAKVKELQNARGRIRHFLGQRIRLRYTPELDFKYDDTTARAGRIESILHDVIPPKPEEEAEVDEGNERDGDDQSPEDS